MCSLQTEMQLITEAAQKTNAKINNNNYNNNNNDYDDDDSMSAWEVWSPVGLESSPASLSAAGTTSSWGWLHRLVSLPLWIHATAVPGRAGPVLSGPEGEGAIP